MSMMPSLGAASYGGGGYGGYGSDPWRMGPTPGQRRLPGFGSPPGEKPLTWEQLSYIGSPQWTAGLINDYANAGYFGDPRTSLITDFGRQQAAQTSQAQQRRAQLQAQVSGLPPQQQGYAYLNSMLGGQGGEASAVNNLLMQQFLRQQEWAKQLVNMRFGLQDTRQPGFDWGSTLGTIGGAAIGGLAGNPGFGAALGKAIF